MFIGREKELITLNRIYNSDKFEFVVIYGRRRVGKTALINRFIEGKPAIYFMGIESNERQNLNNFSRSVLSFSGDYSASPSFLSFHDALEYVFHLAEKERLILAIDEYPYLARSSRGLASTLQLLIDSLKDNSKLMLILCGSSMSYMEDKVLAYKAPLYGRRSAQMKVLPFDFEESSHYFKRFNKEERALAYGIVGGTPQYLLQVDDTKGLEENIKTVFLDPHSFLFEEPTNLLKQEVREPAIYNAIISAIATGSSRMSEISTKVGEPTNVCATYLKNLISLGIVEKESPYGEKASRKSIYTISDPMFRFWYRYIPENASLIARGAADLAYKRIEPHLSDYMGKIFEELSKEYLWKLLLRGNSPVNFASLGRWWGAHPVLKKQVEIDIMGEEDKNRAFFAECKWTREKTPLSVLEGLMEKSEIFHYQDKHFFLFSKSGFTKACIDRAEELGNVSLVSFKEMF